jgi:hypothetical protein
MRTEPVYRIGPADNPSEYHVLAGNDMAAVFVAAHRRWPSEPLFCREERYEASPGEIAAPHG